VLFSHVYCTADLLLFRITKWRMLLAGIWTTNGIPKRKTLSVFIRNSGRLVIFVAVQLVYPPHACTQDFTGIVICLYLCYLGRLEKALLGPSHCAR